jgi:acyl-CoA synthetase (AMP-forming)/AMP-acid ligase II
LRAISRYRATVSPAPDFAYALAAERVADAELEGVDLSCWQVALNGAEAVSRRTLDAFAARFAPHGFRPEALTPVYGLAEASLAVTFTPPGRGARASTFDRDLLVRQGRAVAASEGRTLVSVGIPLPGFAVEVRGPRGERLEAGREGRIWVRGPSLMREYLGHPRATAKALVDGWLDTGDLGFLAQGELFVTGRAKDVVVVRGQNLAPEEIERAAWAVEGARTGCAVAVSRPRPEGGGEELLLFLEHARDVPADALESLGSRAADAVRGSVGVSPARILVLAPGTLPRTSSGKLRRRETLRRWEDDALEAPPSMGPLRLAAALVRSGLAHRRAAAERER